MASVEREIDRLYGLPLDEFTAARNELAKRLKNAGETGEADRVRGLEKSSLPVWTINQLARREKPTVKKLLDAGARVRKAQERALAGSGARDALRKAQADEREALQQLATEAERILETAGRPATRAVVERVRATLRAAAVTETERELLRRGRLTRELTSVGFDALGGVAVAPAPARDELAERRQKKQERERRRNELEAKARELERRAQAADDEAEHAERAADQARDRADQAREEADAAADELASFDSDA